MTMPWLARRVKYAIVREDKMKKRRNNHLEVVFFGEFLTRGVETHPGITTGRNGVVVVDWGKSHAVMEHLQILTASFIGIWFMFRWGRRGWLAGLELGSNCAWLAHFCYQPLGHFQLQWNWINVGLSWCGFVTAWLCTLAVVWGRLCRTPWAV